MLAHRLIRCEVSRDCYFCDFSKNRKKTGLKKISSNFQVILDIYIKEKQLNVPGHTITCQVTVSRARSITGQVTLSRVRYTLTCQVILSRARSHSHVPGHTITYQVTLSRARSHYHMWGHTITWQVTIVRNKLISSFIRYVCSTYLFPGSVSRDDVLLVLAIFLNYFASQVPN